MCTPLVSVLMPVYNAERYVSDAVKSILNQTFKDFEFLIIDDGSTDQSINILQNFADTDNRITLLSRENRGLVNTLNEMIDLASAPLLARMDADDISYPDRFSKQVNFLQKNPPVVCVGGSFEVIDERGRLLTRLHLPENDDEIQRMNLVGHSAIGHPCAMMRSESVRMVGGYDSIAACAEDLDLWLRLGEMGQLANLPDCVLRYRMHAQSVSQLKTDLQRKNAESACHRAWHRRRISTLRYEADGQWRPNSAPDSQHLFMLKFGWWAFNSRQRKTAITYGFKALSIFPCHIKSWKLLLVSLFKPFPKQ